MVRGADRENLANPLRNYTSSNRKEMRLSITLVLLMITALLAPSMVSSPLALEEDQEIYHTANGTIDDASTTTLLSNLNTSNPIEVTGVMDDQQRVHMVWIENGSFPQLHYALIDTDGIDTVLIASTAVGLNSTSALSSPAMVIDSDYRAHIVWAITGTHILYALLDPTLDDQDGSPGDMSSMALVSTHTIAEGTGTRSDPDIAVDSYDAVHVVWVDTYDEQGTFFGAPLIYYAMLAWNASGSNSLSTQINNTIVTPAIGYKGSPAVSMGLNNTVIVVWEDTRGSLIEFVGLLDSSGSMTTEWVDMCAVFYGGNLSSGEYFQGVKPLLEQASITVLETLYALSGNMHFANQHKNCEDAYEIGGYGDGPRDAHLGQNNTDTSGGIRALTDVVYNGSNLNIPSDWGYNSEMWGPGSTWACLSWRDNAGNVPGNPATASDHAWNPNATRLIIPVSDEGPYGGSGNGYQAQEADDYQSVAEAHDACAKAGIIPVPIAGTTSYGASTIWANDTHVRSHMMDLAQCADGATGTHQRTCDGSTWGTTDNEGEMYLYPSNNMANFEGDFESGYLTNGWSSSGAVGWSAEAAGGGPVWSSANLCSIGGSHNFTSESCSYAQPAGVSVDLSVTVDNWPNEFSMDVHLPNGSVDSYNSSAVSSGYSGVIASYTDAGNYTIYLNDSYGDGGSTLSADYDYIAYTVPTSTPISGTYSAQSGDISDSQSSIMEFTGMMAGGTVSFSYNISSEAGYDYLKFYLDGVQLAQWSGAQSGNFSTPVTLGQHTLMWKYEKDGSISSGSDAAWVDDVVVPIANYTQELNALVTEIIGLTSGSGSTETFLTVLNPYSLLNAPRSGWSRGMPAHSVDADTGQYVEDIGPDVDYVWQDGAGWGTIGHFVLVNDTRLTSGHGWSVNPDVNTDDEGNIHVVWVDGRESMPGRDAPSQLHYMQLDLDRAGALDGEADGLNLGEVTIVSDSAVQGSDMTYGANPRVDFDNDGSIHITWFESMPSSEDEDGRVELRWTRINVPQLNGYGEMPLSRDLAEAYAVINTRIITSSNNNLMGIFGNSVDSGSQPIVNFDWPNRDIVWTTDECDEQTTGSSNNWEVCMWSENVWDVRIDFESGQDESVVLQPGQSINIDLIADAQKISGTSDIATISIDGEPDYWFVDAGFKGTYQHSTTLVEGSSEELDIFLRAPTLRDVNEDQEFLLIATLTSTTKDEGTTHFSIPISLVNPGDWNDDDGDGIADEDDDCQFGDSSWISSELTDHDGDGCRDSTEDDDDDQDGVLDEDDNCASGTIGQIVDADSDGCDDLTEDYDRDGDGVLNEFDLCPDGAQYWSEFAIDHDGDGCRDADEDNNDDNDPYLDDEDDCPAGATGWSNPLFDHDGDGCHDSFDDLDDDNDQILDVDDSCPRGEILWLSEPATDRDGDGCFDLTEDADRDNDGITEDDGSDLCPMGMFGWDSTALNDWDRDGCNDIAEDNDDDNDGFIDSADSCPRSVMNPEDRTDLDQDGCWDLYEDNDLDNDGIETDSDNCEENRQSDWVSTIEEDKDRDGCHDLLEDADDDGDGVLDSRDNCPSTHTVTMDLDRDGCDDETEDTDDDGDGISDGRDRCPNGITNWVSNKKSDVDRDGCMDSLEDTDVQMSVIQLMTSNSVMTAGIISITTLLLAALVLRQRESRISKQDIDQTDRVESTLDDSWRIERKSIDKEIEDLTDVGYSPEVAQAILENEILARKKEDLE